MNGEISTVNNARSILARYNPNIRGGEKAQGSFYNTVAALDEARIDGEITFSQYRTAIRALKTARNAHLATRNNAQVRDSMVYETLAETLEAPQGEELISERVLAGDRRIISALHQAKLELIAAEEREKAQRNRDNEVIAKINSEDRKQAA